MAPRSLVGLVAVALVAACAPSPIAGPKNAAPDVTSVTSKGKGRPPSPAPGGGSPVVPSATPKATIAPGTDTLAAAALAGRVTAPAKILSDAGLGIVSDSGGSLISDRGGSLITDNGAGVVSNNGSNLRLLAAPEQKATSGAEVQLVDAAGEPLLDAAGRPYVTRTDQTGRYAFAEAPQGRHVLVRVKLGALGELTAIAARDRAARATVDLDLASTLTATYIVDQYIIAQKAEPAVLDRLPADVELATRAATASSLAAADAVAPASLRAAEVVSVVNGLRKGDAKLDAQFEVVRKLLVVGGSASQTDGSALEAALAQPRGLALDADGSLYIADAKNNLIRKLARDGTISTVAGNGTGANSDGKGREAGLYEPYGLALDGRGNLFVTCRGPALRKIDLRDPDHPVTSLVALDKGAFEGDGGPVAQAKLANPLGLAVDRRDPAKPVLYVMDNGNHRIRRINLAEPGMPINTIAGIGASGYADGLGSGAKFAAAQGLAISPDGELYVADTDNHRIRVIDLDAAGLPVSTLAGTGKPGIADGPAAAAAFNKPAGLALTADGKLIVAELLNHAVRVIDLRAPGRPVTTLAGGGLAGLADGAGALASFNRPQGLAADAAGNVYVADSFNQAVRKIDAAGVVTTVAGKARATLKDGQGTEALFNRPRGIALGADGTFYVADTFNRAIRKVTAEGVVSTIAGADGKTFSNVYAVAYDGHDAARPALLVADTNNNAIKRVALADGAITTVVGAAGGLSSPYGLATDGKGKLYVADTRNHRILMVDLTKADFPLVTIAGSGQPGSADGAGTAASFNQPFGVLVVGDALFVADAYNHAIRKVALADPNRPVTTVAGNGKPGKADGAGTAASFNLPFGLATDPEGDLYVCDNGNNLIRKIGLAAPGFPVTTPAGGAKGSDVGKGATTEATFASPSGLAIDAAGTLYVVDAENNRIRILPR